MVVQLHRYSGAAFRCLRYDVEHVLNEGPLPWLPPSVAMDLMPSMRAVVVTWGLVRTGKIIGLVRAMSEQACSSPVFLAALAGLLSGTLLGFLFRNSDAERRQAEKPGFRHWSLRALYSPIWSLSGLIFLALAAGLAVGSVWLPLRLTGIVPLCRPAAVVYEVAMMAGVFVGWFVRYLVWRAYLRHL